MTPRENYFAMLNREKQEFVPSFGRDMRLTALELISAVDFPSIGPGTDMFGVPWVMTQEGTITEPGFVLFDDIADWKEYVHFPDLDSVDFKGAAEKEMAGVDRNEQVSIIFGVYGVFMRLVSLMGFENALMALAADPDSCAEFFDACSDYHVDYVNRLCDAYHVDVMSYIEDVAASTSLFFSPEVYRELILHYHKKVMDAIIANGAIPQMHTCGYCTDVLDNYVNIGVRIWNSAQPCNDLSAILDKYEGKLVVEGGWDTQGACSQIGATQEDLIKEADRCMSEYGTKKGFSLFIILMNERGNAIMVGDERMPLVNEELAKWDEKLFGKAN